MGQGEPGKLNAFICKTLIKLYTTTANSTGEGCHCIRILNKAVRIRNAAAAVTTYGCGC